MLDKDAGEARIISLMDAAKLLGTSYPTALRLARSGELKAFKIHRIWRTSTSACDEYIKRRFAEQALMCQSVEEE